MGKVIILVVGLLLVFTIATAYNLSKSVGRSIEMNTRQNIAERRAAAARVEAWHRMEIAKEKAIAPAKVQAAQNFYFGLATVGVVGSGLLFAALVFSGCYAAVGFSRAAVKMANTRATLIQLDPKTRQYPLLPYQVGGHLRVYNPNTGNVVSLNQLLPANPQMVTASGAVQLAGVIASEASKASDPAGVAIVNPPLVIESEVQHGPQNL